MKQYIIDAFADRVFRGNPTAVAVAEKQLPDKRLQEIAGENNLPETAFVVKSDTGYDLRFFTPYREIKFCGHAALAAAFLILNRYEPDTDRIVFHSKAGELAAGRSGDEVTLEFPAFKLREIPITPLMTESLGARPERAYLDRDMLLVYRDEETVRRLAPDFEKMLRLDGLGVCVTAPAEKYDYVARFFVPKLRANEDPATGSIHCMIGPYWSELLGKNELTAYQASARGGTVRCRVADGRVTVAGRAVIFSEALLFLPEE